MKSALHNANVPALRYTLATLAAAFAFAAMWLSAIEVWQRPLWTINLDENRMRFAAISASLIAMIAWPGSLRRRWWLRAGIWATVCTSMGFFLHFAAREAATRTLFKHPVVEEASFSWITTSPPSPPGFWSEIFAELRDKIQLPATDRYRPDDEYLPHLIETSRWPVRRAWIEKVMRDEGAAFLVTNGWNHYFPAVVGQDVTLRNRRELIELLNDIHLDPSLPNNNRDAAALWMSLIVLTDPVEFADWRVAVRDTMLKQNHPPWAGRVDVGMRMIDALLAFDTQDEAARLTQRFLDDAYLTRRALRERVCGFDSHATAIIEAIEKHPDSRVDNRYTIPMFVDLIQMVNRMTDESNADLTREWIEEKILRWMKNHESLLIQRLSWPDPHIKDALQMHLQEESLQNLAVHAERLLNDKNEQGNDQRESDPISRVMLIRILLNEPRRIALSRQIGDFFIAQKNLTMRTSYRVIEIWQDLSEAQQQHFSEILGRSMKSQVAKGRDTEWISSLEWSYWIHPSLGLTEAETLGLIAARGYYVPSYMENGRVPPQLSRHAVDTYLAACEKAELNQEDQLIQIDPDGTLEFKRDFFDHILNRHDRDIMPSATRNSRTRFLLSLIRRGIVSAEHLGEDLLPVAREAPMLVQSILYDTHFDSLSLFFDPDDNYRLLRMVLEAHEAQIFKSLPRAMRRYTVPQDAMDLIIAHYHGLSATADFAQRISAYKILFALEEQMPPQQQQILRREFLDFFEKEKPTPDEWEPLAKRNGFYSPVSRVTWRDDALSARLGWMGWIYSETDQSLNNLAEYPALKDEVFFHLANASTATSLRQRRLSLEDVMTPDYWNTQPPSLPLSPTPWQRARELHQRRPDLEFPDRALFRPTRGNR